MAKPTVELGGKTRSLRYEMNALAELEDALRAPMSDIGRRMAKGKVGAREIRALTWAGLLHEVDDVSDLPIREVGEWLNAAGFLKDEASREKLMGTILDALKASFPEAAEKADKAEADSGN